MYITTLIYNNYICTYTPKKNKFFTDYYQFLWIFLFLSFLPPILVAFVGVSGFSDSVFFEKSLILCFVWIVFLLWLFLFGSSLCFRSGRLDFYFDVSPRPLNDRRTKY